MLRLSNSINSVFDRLFDTPPPKVFTITFERKILFPPGNQVHVTFMVLSTNENP